MKPQENKYAVGDKLAFRGGYGNGSWEIHEIERITPSGRIVCGRFTLNPDLSIRGRSGYSGPFKGEPVTEEIENEYRRQKNLQKIDDTKFHLLSDSALAAIVDVIKSEKRLQEKYPNNKNLKNQSGG